MASGSSIWPEKDHRSSFTCARSTNSKRRCFRPERMWSARSSRPTVNRLDSWRRVRARWKAVMKRIPITGGTPVTIAPVGGAIRGASWSPDGTIVFGTLDVKSGLWRVPSAGGTPEPLTPPPEAGTDYYFPEVLPGGRAVLFTIVRRRPGGPPGGPFQVAVFDLSTREQKVLIEGGSNARYSESGHLVYAADGTLRAVPFDLRSLQVRGDPAPVLEGVVTKVSGAADFAMAGNGTLVYRTGSVFGLGTRTLLWVDRQGREEPVPAAPRRYTHLSLSPNGSQVALDAQDQQNDIWIWNFSRQILSRATFDPRLKGASFGRRTANGLPIRKSLPTVCIGRWPTAPGLRNSSRRESGLRPPPASHRTDAR